jgi:hypothetical protein
MDALILGGTSALYQPNALDAFAGSAEASIELELKTRMETPDGVAGEVVFRRLHVVVIHTSGCAFYVTPIIDGFRYTGLRTYFSRPAPTAGQTEERFTFLLELYVEDGTFDVTTSPRGIAGEIEVEITDPGARFHIEDAVFAVEPLNTSRARMADE